MIKSWNVGKHLLFNLILCQKQDTDRCIHMLLCFFWILSPIDQDFFGPLCFFRVYFLMLQYVDVCYGTFCFSNTSKFHFILFPHRHYFCSAFSLVSIVHFHKLWSIYAVVVFDLECTFIFKVAVDHRAGIEDQYNKIYSEIFCVIKINSF